MPAATAIQSAALNTMLDQKALLDECKAEMGRVHIAFLSGNATTNAVRAATADLDRAKSAFNKANASLTAANLAA
jgi:hypothetical protein